MGVLLWKQTEKAAVRKTERGSVTEILMRPQLPTLPPGREETVCAPSVDASPCFSTKTTVALCELRSQRNENKDKKRNKCLI